MSSFEQKYCIGTRDRQHQVVWDITALLKDLQDTHFPIQNYKVSDLVNKNNFFGNPEYAMNTDIEKPCIIVTLCNNAEKLIDGNHRLYKAKQLNLDFIPCYILPFEYHKNFIINYNFEIYDKVVADFAV